MSGTLEYLGEKPKVGDRVYIHVDQVNSPTGFWVGELVSIGKQWESGTCACQAKIIDPKAKMNGFPSINYRVYDAHRAVEWQLEARAKDRKEINALKRRMQIEGQTYRAALKAIASPQGFEGFKALLDDFLGRLSR